MKKIAFITGLLFAGIMNVFAQDMNGFHVGGRFGMGESNVLSNSLRNTQPALHVSGGIASAYHFNSFLSINADFLLSSNGVKATGFTETQDIFGNTMQHNYQEKYNFVGAEVPVTGQVKLWLGDFCIGALAGPSVNFNLMANSTRTFDDTEYDRDNGYANKKLNTMNSMNYSITYGAGIGARSKDKRIFFLDLRVSNGLSPVGKIGGHNAWMNYYSINAGYLF